MRSNRVPQREERAKVEYELVREMESFISKRNGALDKECENAKSLTMLSRDLVLKEAKKQRGRELNSQSSGLIMERYQVRERKGTSGIVTS